MKNFRLTVENIHVMSLYPIFKKFFETGAVPDELKHLSFISPEMKYLEYMINAYNPEQRDYHLLRNLLHDITYYYSNTIINAYKILLPENINKVIDIGAGHEGYINILRTFYNDAEFILIDKDEIIVTNDNYNFIQTDIFDYLDSFKGNKNILIHMSEFLHCKKDNLEILKNPEILKCRILINELDAFEPENEYINYRLKQTGGELIRPLDIYKYLGQIPFIRYKTLFSYRSFFYDPF
jgi:hypothetical protein